MGKKKGLAAIFSKPKPDSSPSPPWPWPSCANTPQTASFRRNGANDDRPCTTAGFFPAGAGRLVPPRKAAGDMYKTVNSVYLDPADSSSRFSAFDEGDEDGERGHDEIDEALDDGVSYSTTTASEEWSEAVIRSLGRRTCTDRFFFDSGPPPASNSILAASRSPSPSPSPSPGRALVTQQSPEPKAPPPAVMPGHREGDSDEEFEEEEEPGLPPPSPLVKESVAVALDSDDPYGDFRESMEEMVAAHGLRDWASLQEMLLWYLRINAKHNHALVLGTFVDLLVGLVSSSTATSRSGAATTTTTAITATETTSSSSSTSSVAGDGAACSSTAATVDEHEQCGGGGVSGSDASCCPTASSSDQEDEEDPPVGKKKSKAIS